MFEAARLGRAEVALALLGAAGLVLAAVLAPWLKFVLTIALAKGIAVLGILLLLRAGQVSFGHALYIALAAYVVAFLAPLLPETLLLLPLAALASALLGLVVGLFVARYREIFFGMLNLALSMVFYSVLEKFYAVTRGTDGIRVEVLPVAGLRLDREGYEWALFAIALALAFAAGWFVRIYLASPMGQALAGIKTRETRLEFMGVAPRRVLLAAYVLSALFGGLAGAIIAMTARHVTPLLAYWTASGELVFIAILGGAGGVLGPFLGATVFELVRVYAAAAFAEAWQAILGAVLLLVILFAPGGLWGVIAGALRGKAPRGMSDALLQARGLRLAFGGVKAADGIDLDVLRGEFLAIIGPNGAGKTTFINMTTGYLHPQAGSIAYEGETITRLPPRGIVRRGIARSFQLPQLFAEHTVLENAALAVAAREGIWSPLAPLLRPRWRDEAWELLDRFGLAGLADARADALNEGARKLADIAMAVALRPRLLLMDEPTSGVAATEKMGIVETLVRVLRGAEVTAVFVEHDMDVVERFADRVAVWSQGRIAALGPPAEVLADPKVQREVIGIERHA